MALYMKYTEEDIKVLEECYGTHTLSWLQSRLSKPRGEKRTTQAIRRKAAKMGLEGYRNRLDTITQKDLAECMGFDVGIVYKWAEWGLEITYGGLNKKRFSQIKPKDWWEFAYKNKHRIDFRRYKEKSILPEPDWVKKEIGQKKLTPERWTQNDILTIKLMRMKGFTVSDISKKLGRTMASTRKQICKLIKSGELQKACIAVPFSKDEIELMHKLRMEGKSYNYIAEELGRSLTTVRKKMVSLM